MYINIHVYVDSKLSFKNTRLISRCNDDLTIFFSTFFPEIETSSLHCRPETSKRRRNTFRTGIWINSWRSTNLILSQNTCVIMKTTHIEERSKNNTFIEASTTVQNCSCLSKLTDSKIQKQLVPNHFQLRIKRIFKVQFNRCGWVLFTGLYSFITRSSRKYN